MNNALLKYVGSVALGLSVLAGPQYVRGDESDRSGNVVLEDLTQTDVDALLRRSSVDDILREELGSGRVSRVVYDASNRRTNFRDLVYQENVVVAERRPVLMLVADADGRGPFTAEQYVFDRTAAIVFKNNMRRFEDVSFVFYDPSVAPDYRVDMQRNRFDLGAELDSDGLAGRPSQVLYCPWDFTAGETQNRNSGIVKKLDILRNGPVPSGTIILMRNCINWISSNIEGNYDHYVWRANNTSPTNWSRINY